MARTDHHVGSSYHDGGTEYDVQMTFWEMLREKRRGRKRGHLCRRNPLTVRECVFDDAVQKIVIERFLDKR